MLERQSLSFTTTDPALEVGDAFDMAAVRAATFALGTVRFACFSPLDGSLGDAEDEERGPMLAKEFPLCNDDDAGRGSGWR